MTRRIGVGSSRVAHNCGLFLRRVTPLSVPFPTNSCLAGKVWLLQCHLLAGVSEAFSCCIRIVVKSVETPACRQFQVLCLLA